MPTPKPKPYKPTRFQALIEGAINCRIHFRHEEADVLERMARQELMKRSGCRKERFEQIMREMSPINSRIDALKDRLRHAHA